MAVRGHLSTNKNAKCYHHCSFIRYAIFTFSIKCKWLAQCSIQFNSQHINRWASHKKVISRSHIFPFQFLHFQVATPECKVSKNKKMKRIHKSQRVESCSNLCHSVTCNNVCLSLGFRWLSFYDRLRNWTLNSMQHLMLCPTGFYIYTMYACVHRMRLDIWTGGSFFYYHTKPSAHHSIPNWMKGINEPYLHWLISMQLMSIWSQFFLYPHR